MLGDNKKSWVYWSPYDYSLWHIEQLKLFYVLTNFIKLVNGYRFITQINTKNACMQLNIIKRLNEKEISK